MNERDTERMEFHRALHETFDSLAGKQVLAWLKQRACYGRTRFQSGDMHLTCVWMGEQNIVNEIVAQLAVPPEEWHRTDEQKPENADWLFQGEQNVPRT